jgi:hypothetical protein
MGNSQNLQIVVNSLATGNTTPAPLPAPATTVSPEVPSPEVPKEPQNAAAPATDDVAEKGGAVAADAGKEGHGNQKNNLIFWDIIYLPRVWKF